MNNNPNGTVSADTPERGDTLSNSQIVSSFQTPPIRPNRNAMKSFVISILSLFALWVIPLVGVVSSAAALVFGLKARKELRVSNSSGGRLAITGLVCGCLSLILSVVGCPLVWFFIIAVTY